MEIVIRALNEAKNIIDAHIENINNEDIISDVNKVSIILLINSIKVECECDDYNGFDCECSNRDYLIDLAIDELKQF